MHERLWPVRAIPLAGKTEGEACLCRPCGLQINVSEPQVCTLAGGSSLLLDFGREVCGSVRILTHQYTGTLPVHLRLGESWGEANAALGEHGACNDHAPRDVSVTVVAYSDLCFCQSAFRFCRLDVPAGAAWAIKGICAEGERYDAPPVWQYTGTDPQIAAIAGTAKRTVDLCVQHGTVWDGAKRDRLVWAGDLYPELLALTTLYGRCPPLETALKHLCDTTAPGAFMNDFPQYSAWWLICMAEYAPFAPAFLAECAEAVQQTAALVASCVQEDGSLVCSDYFLDWPTHKQTDEYEGCRAITLLCARKLRELYAAMGWDPAVPDTMFRRLQSRPITVIASKQAAALKWFATGSLTPEETALLSAGEGLGGTFLSYFVLTALAETAGTETALTAMKRYYGGMLERGATTFFEDFQPQWLQNSGRIDAPTEPGQWARPGD